MNGRNPTDPQSEDAAAARSMIGRVIRRALQTSWEVSKRVGEGDVSIRYCTVVLELDDGRFVGLGGKLTDLTPESLVPLDRVTGVKSPDGRAIDAVVDSMAYPGPGVVLEGDVLLIEDAYLDVVGGVTQSWAASKDVGEFWVMAEQQISP